MDETTATAVEGMSEAVKAELAKAFGSVQAQAMDGILVALPFALSIMGLGMGIRIAINFFKGVAN